MLQSFHTFVGIKGMDKANKWEDYEKYMAAVEEDCAGFAAPVPPAQEGHVHSAR